MKRIHEFFRRAYGTRILFVEALASELAGYYQRSLRDHTVKFLCLPLHGTASREQPQTLETLLGVLRLRRVIRKRIARLRSG